MSKQNIIKALKSGCKNVFIPDGVDAIYIYGSILRGKLRSDSDIDIAMLARYNIDAMERLGLIACVETIFTDILKSMGFQHEVNVLDMKGKYVSLQLLYEVLTKGVCVYEKSHGDRQEFENSIKGEYFDFVPFLMSLRKRKYGFIYQKA